MSAQNEIDDLARQLHKYAPAGLFYALHFRFVQPLTHYCNFPREWSDLYSEEAFALRDPVIAWGFGNTGTSRWSEIDIPDHANILGQAATFGLHYGFVVAVGPIKSRTIASAARSDREFTDAEIEPFAAIVTKMHKLAEPPDSLTHAQIEALRLVEVGDRHTAAAAKLGISESAFKARLASARNSLKARTTVEAIQRARNLKLL
ncbi:LuxR family transcriptional regulator [Salipiger sp. IMCC34102]|uniref:autoinducer binding domain-containing protein n=1 Tax=Salipiger sp. IMCC34102 TaxID=2510647 RepID=UPI00101C1E5E|nr:autoinducer binding domain-containing protein [Salipiger sp. IMCC34102]RYH04396.1 LuxR family transcriptional regulator [Salipiger sp. IMCC34102]